MTVGSLGQAGEGGAGSGAGFQRRWPRLRDAHLRALAWLLDAPDLMDADAACWQGRIASLGPVDDTTRAWLLHVQDDPVALQALHQHLAHQPSARLGRYAEKLLAFYLMQRHQLVAANLQVRNTGPGGETLGEFDFLVRRPETGGVLEHWEFATKFYLLAPAQADAVPQEAFVGPNLADSLGRKMRKIMDRQLMLGSHPAAMAVLPAPVARAGALVKGWLFYPDGVRPGLPVDGIAPDHCHGFWCEAPAMSAHAVDGRRFVLLQRLAWLAPARLDVALSVDLAGLQLALARRFAQEEAPVLVAVCRVEGEEVFEIERGFIVPPEWSSRAAEQAQHVPYRV